MQKEHYLVVLRVAGLLVFVILSEISLHLGRLVIEKRTRWTPRSLFCD